MKRKRNAVITRRLQYANAAIGVGRAAYNAYKGYSKMRNNFSNSRKTVEVRPLTDQRDVITTYRKRRMPRRKKRAYVRSLKRWQSNQLRLSPSRIFQYVYADDFTWNQGTCIYFGSFSGLFGQNYQDNNLGEAWTSITNGTAADDKARAGHFRLDHQSLRIVLRNLTSADAINSTPTVDIDVYKVVCIRDIPTTLWPSGTSIEVFMAGLKNQLRRANGMDIEVSTAGAGIATLQQNAGTDATNQPVGDSLWNNPVFLRYFKILKTFKIQLGTNNQTEFSWRDSKNRIIPRQQCFEGSQGGLAARKGVTRGYIFNVNGRAYIESGTGLPIFNSGAVVMESYVRYNVKCIQGTSPTLVYDGV